VAKKATKAHKRHTNELREQTSRDNSSRVDSQEANRAKFEELLRALGEAFDPVRKFEESLNALEEQAREIKATPPELRHAAARVAIKDREFGRHCEDLIAAIGGVRSFVERGDARRAAWTGYLVGQCEMILRYRTNHEEAEFYGRDVLSRLKKMSDAAARERQHTPERNAEDQRAFEEALRELLRTHPEQDWTSRFKTIAKDNKTSYERVRKLTQSCAVQLGFQSRPRQKNE
jgi:hypothetical protein